MSNGRRLRETPFQRRLAAVAVADLGMTNFFAEGRTARGTVLETWMYRVARGGVMPYCGHPDGRPGPAPKVLFVDDPEPMIRCMPCETARLTSDAKKSVLADRICRLCEAESATFIEFVYPLLDGVTVVGNACPSCMAEIRAGKPSPP